MPGTLPPHGTSSRYARGCRGEACTKAASRADLQRKVDRAAGKPRTVSAGPAAEHVRKLVAQGLSYMQIERACGVSPAAVARLLNGQKRIFLENEKKILAVPLSVRVDLGDVPACGAVRRVRALYALGHFNLQIAAAAGMSRDAIGHLAAGRYQTLKVKADDGIRAAYDQLSMQAGSSWKTRKLAEERGWAPPLAWDDDTIDDPAAVPQLDAPQAGFTEGDDVANRFLMGESVVLDREARRAVICHLMEWSTETPEEIGSRLEMSEGAVSQVWVRVKREARIAGQPVPWRRVYVSLSEMNLTKDDLRSAA